MKEKKIITVGFRDVNLEYKNKVDELIHDYYQKNSVKLKQASFLRLLIDKAYREAFIKASIQK